MKNEMKIERFEKIGSYRGIDIYVTENKKDIIYYSDVLIVYDNNIYYLKRQIGSIDDKFIEIADKFVKEAWAITDDL